MESANSTARPLTTANSLHIHLMGVLRTMRLRHPVSLERVAMGVAPVSGLYDRDLHGGGMGRSSISVLPEVARSTTET
jgi:hypothetical protein